MLTSLALQDILSLPISNSLFLLIAYTLLSITGPLLTPCYVAFFQGEWIKTWLQGGEFDMTLLVAHQDMLHPPTYIVAWIVLILETPLVSDTHICIFSLYNSQYPCYPSIFILLSFWHNICMVTVQKLLISVWQFTLWCWKTCWTMAHWVHKKLRCNASQLLYCTRSSRFLWTHCLTSNNIIPRFP